MTTRQRAPWTRALLRCGVIAGPAFAAVFLAEGAIRDSYQPLRHPVSSLALGSRGWIQAANFAVTGTLVLAAAAGLARAGDPAAGRRAAPILIGAAPWRGSRCPPGRCVIDRQLRP